MRARGNSTARRLAAAIAAALCALILAAPAAAEFGVSEFDVTFTDADGSPVAQAGAHPFAMSTSVHFNPTVDPVLGEVPDEEVKDLVIEQIAGLAGNPTATPRCSTLEFLEQAEPEFEGVKPDGHYPDCQDNAAVGATLLSLESPAPITAAAVYNLVPPPGVAAKLGFWALSVPVTIEIAVNPTPPYKIRATVSNIAQPVPFFGSDLTLWGVPADPAHDTLRGHCVFAGLPDSLEEIASNGSCAAKAAPEPFLTVPRACEGPLATSYETASWVDPGDWVRGSVLTHDDAVPPNPQGFSGCSRLAFGPQISASPTSRAASSPTGLDFGLEVEDEGLTNPDGLAGSDIRKTVVTLPRGMTANPSLAEGLEVCSETQVDRETPFSEPGAGCPQASKIGTIEVETPLLEGETLKGSLYQAEPYANPFGTLIALYVVISDPELGIGIVQPLKVEPDPETGQLVSTAEEMPQLPFSEFRLHFREGGRSPLISPPGCGTHTVEAKLYPWAGGPPVESGSSFEIVSGPDNGPCPSAAPFAPGFSAGTVNNSAGAYSPFLMRLTRGDGEQDLSKFSAVLPPGVLGSVAGIPWCPEAAIAQAKARTGPHGATEELADPSCPAASQVGRTVAGAGVGSQLTYVGGALYLAGPYNGAPLSVVSVTPAKAGPFDAGTVVVREALTLNPITARVEVDGAASDPIPHILKGIPLNLRDLRVYADRPGFTLNATNCAESHTLATLWGAGTALDPAPDTPVGLSARYQAADCAALGFEPRLGVKLKGGVKRGAHPALKAVVTPRPGQANFDRAVVTLPRSAFLEQAHIRTICTRVQFAAGPGNGALCPPGAQYGYARAWSPLLDGPAQGPVYLRSSDNKLPDLVVALKGPASAPFEVELSARIDSVRGGIRSTFAGIPDVPVSRFVLGMQGGKKGLIVNSRHLCRKPKRNRATSNIRGQNGRFSKTRPRVIATTCQKRRKAKRKRANRSHARVASASAVG